jgi:hypothetical protein
MIARRQANLTSGRAVLRQELPLEGPMDGVMDPGSLSGILEISFSQDELQALPVAVQLRGQHLEFMVVPGTDDRDALLD